MDPVISVENLGIERDDARILSGVTWSVKPGSHCVILGANGSGKTSLLQALTGYLTPTRGRIQVLGEEFGTSDWRELRQRIGLVSSGIAQLMHEEDPAGEIVAGGRRAMIGIWGRVSRADRERSSALLKSLRASHLRLRRWGVLSQGERQRVLIARALMSSPAVLILDEPCAGMDPLARELFLQDLSRIESLPSAPTLVLVTHHVEEILPLFTDVLALREGRVVFSGPKKKALTAPVLQQVFGAPVRVRCIGGRYDLRISPPAHKPS